MVTHFKKVGLLLSLLMMSGCTKLIFGAVNAPTYFGDMTTKTDIIYNAQSKQKLDVYAPKETTKNPRPVIVFYYGGRWTDGQKSDYRFVADRLTRAGFVVVIPDYRKYPAVKFPVFVDDSADALAWVAQNIKPYGGADDKIYLMGHSAGAHIASLLVTDKNYLKDRKINPQTIRAFAGLAGPYSFTPDEPDLKDMFAPPENYAAMQATSFVDGVEPPMLLLHGHDDDLVKVLNLEKLEKKVKDKNGSVKSILYPNVDHVDIVGAFSWAKKDVAPVSEDVINFFKSH